MFTGATVQLLPAVHLLLPAAQLLRVLLLQPDLAAVAQLRHWVCRFEGLWHTEDS
jgi:hypothetical protein